MTLKSLIQANGLPIVYEVNDDDIVLGERYVDMLGKSTESVHVAATDRLVSIFNEASMRSRFKKIVREL